MDRMMDEGMSHFCSNPDLIW